MQQLTFAGHSDTQCALKRRSVQRHDYIRIYIVFVYFYFIFLRQTACKVTQLLHYQLME